MNNWTSVKEKLPEHGDEYIVTWAIRDGGNPVSTVMMFDFMEGTWDDRGFDRTPEVTHWMPLPKPAGRRGHPRMEINKPQDLLDIMEDMFHDFLSDLIEKDWATTDVTEDDWPYHEEGFQFIYTIEGQRTVNSYYRRMGNLFRNHYPDSHFEINSHLFKEP